jgi:hypothetical protein
VVSVPKEPPNKCYCVEMKIFHFFCVHDAAEITTTREFRFYLMYLTNSQCVSR